MQTAKQNRTYISLYGGTEAVPFAFPKHKPQKPQNLFQFIRIVYYL